MTARIVVQHVPFCEVERRDGDGLHPCGRSAGHAGDHVCALVDVCGVTWARVEVIVSEHLGPCDTCRQVVRAGSECSDCLENAGHARHDACCTVPFGGLL